jgi:hypothetical protein
MKEPLKALVSCVHDSRPDAMHIDPIENWLDV